MISRFPDMMEGINLLYSKPSRNWYFNQKQLFSIIDLGLSPVGYHCTVAPCARDSSRSQWQVSVVCITSQFLHILARTDVLCIHQFLHTRVKKKKTIRAMVDQEGHRKYISSIRVCHISGWALCCRTGLHFNC